MSIFSKRQGKPSQEKQEKGVECQEKVKKIFLLRYIHIIGKCESDLPKNHVSDKKLYIFFGYCFS